jgi:hypothetical protein
MKIEYEINKKTLKNLVIKLLKMRNIILMFLLLFILTINAYAIKEIDIKGITIPDKTNFTNTKLYIPKKVKINNHTLQVFKPSN